MRIRRSDLFIIVFVIVGLLFLSFLSVTGDRWSVANAQGGTVPPTRTPDPGTREVPEADTLLLFGGGLGGLATWLGWQRSKIRTKK